MTKFKRAISLLTATAINRFLLQTPGAHLKHYEEK